MGLKKKKTQLTDPREVLMPCPFDPHWTETLSQIQVGHTQAKRTLVISYVHTQNLSHHRAFQESAFLNCLALSAFHICSVLRAFIDRRDSGKRGSQSTYAGFPGLTPLVTEGRSSSGEWPQDKLHPFYIFRHNHSPASLQEIWGPNLKIHLFPYKQS